MAAHPANWTPVPPLKRLDHRIRRRLRTDPALRDQLFWLTRPDQPGPSGATAPLTRLRLAQRAAFGPDSAPADRLYYAELENQLLRDRDNAVATLAMSGPRHRARPLLIKLAGGFALAGAVAVLAATAGPLSEQKTPAKPSQSSSTVALRLDPEGQAQLQHLFVTGRAAPARAALLRRTVQAMIDTTADTPLTAGGSIGPIRRAVPGGIEQGSSTHAIDGSRGGAITIAVITEQAVAWQARLSYNSGPAVSVEGAAVRGRFQYVVVLAGPNQTPTKLSFSLPDPVTYSWQVLQRS